jgi:hypothetical protein
VTPALRCYGSIVSQRYRKRGPPTTETRGAPHQDLDAKSLGATIIKDVHEVPDAGWLSIISDPTGAVLGLLKSKTA